MTENKKFVEHFLNEMKCLRIKINKYDKLLKERNIMMEKQNLEMENIANELKHMTRELQKEKDLNIKLSKRHEREMKHLQNKINRSLFFEDIKSIKNKKHEVLGKQIAKTEKINRNLEKIIFEIGEHFNFDAKLLSLISEFVDLHEDDTILQKVLKNIEEKENSLNHL